MRKLLAGILSVTLTFGCGSSASETPSPGADSATGADGTSSDSSASSDGTSPTATTASDSPTSSDAPADAAGDGGDGGDESGTKCGDAVCGPGYECCTSAKPPKCTPIACDSCCKPSPSP